MKSLYIHACVPTCTLRGMPAVSLRQVHSVPALPTQSRLGPSPVNPTILDFDFLRCLRPPGFISGRPRSPRIPQDQHPHEHAQSPSLATPQPGPGVFSASLARFTSPGGLALSRWARPLAPCVAAALDGRRAGMYSATMTTLSHTVLLKAYCRPFEDYTDYAYGCCCRLALARDNRQSSDCWGQGQGQRSPAPAPAPCRSRRR